MQKIVLFFLGALIISLGFIRDHIFVNINAMIYSQHYNDSSIVIPKYFSFMSNLTSNHLYLLKWGLTILFAILFFTLSFLFIRIYFFNSKKHNSVVIICYLGLFIISFLITIVGYIFPVFTKEAYTLSRYLMGMLQSPIILMILFPLLYFFKTSFNNTSQR